MADSSAEVTARHALSSTLRYHVQLGDVRILFPIPSEPPGGCLTDFVDAPDFSLDDIYQLPGFCKRIFANNLAESLYDATKNELSRRTGVSTTNCKTTILR